MVQELVPPHLDQSITNGMPNDFNTPFGICNLVMETNNSGGRLLHANKELLAYVSHYFYNLLIAGKEPSKQEETITITLDVDFSVMEMILRFVYNIERNYVKAGGYFVDCSQETIVNFLKAAKKFEFPRIFEDFKAACMIFPSVKLVEAAIELGMSSEKTIFLRRLGGGQLRKLIRKKSDVPAFSRADIKCFFDEMERNKTKTILNPEKITQKFAKNALPIFYDVSIITFDGIIKCNKSLLAVFSPYFKALFFSDFNDKCKEIIEMDVSSENFSLLVEILVDKCAGTVDLKEKQCAELYKVADQYDFPCIREFCRQHFVNYNLASSLKIALLLDFKEQKANVIAKMKYPDFKTWHDESEGNNMPLLSHNDLDALMQRCYATSPMYKCCQRYSNLMVGGHVCQTATRYVQRSWHLQDDAEHSRRCLVCGRDQLTEAFREE